VDFATKLLSVLDYANNGTTNITLHTYRSNTYSCGTPLIVIWAQPDLVIKLPQNLPPLLIGGTVVTIPVVVSQLNPAAPTSNTQVVITTNIGTSPTITVNGVPTTYTIVSGQPVINLGVVPANSPPYDIEVTYTVQPNSPANVSFTATLNYKDSTATNSYTSFAFGLEGIKPELK
jgi:hypothetical protein